VDLTLNKVLDVGFAPVEWLASEDGTDKARTITLDVASFTTAATYYPNGRLLSGLPLGKHTSGGKSGQYGLYTSGDATGLQVCVGFLYRSVPVSYAGGYRNQGATASTAVPVAGALLWRGVVKKAALDTIYGASLPAGVLTDLAAKFRFE
jgi:hypothetical protein